MASIREYTRKDGSRTWRVLWRDPDDGGQHSTSFTREADAKRFKIVLEQHGGSFESAGLAIDRAQREGVTMGQLFDAYIKSLTAPSSDTVAGYESIRASRQTVSAPASSNGRHRCGPTRTASTWTTSG